MMTNVAPTSKLKSALAWLDEHLMLLLTGFLIAFIPLYPKIPLAELLPGYIVRLRLEDLLIGGTAIIWFVQLLRRKAALRTPLTWIIIAYLLAGLASSFSAIYLVHTVPENAVHINKLFLHYFRRVEYFSLFFIAYSAIRRKKDALLLLWAFIIATLLVGIYGMGQKYLYWPVYSTMNREFSKGLRLYLTEHARVQSTFGGHYDFAAFLVMALPLVLAFFFSVKRSWKKVLLGVTYLVGLWGLMMTSSRSSFLAYLAAIIILIFLMAVKNGFKWGVIRLFGIGVVTTLFLLTFGDLLLRFSQVLNGTAFDAWQATLQEATKVAQAPIVSAPTNGISIDDVNKAAEEAAKLATPKPVIDVSDTQPTVLPPDVYEDIPDKVIATRSAEGAFVEIIVPRVFSQNAHLLGLSAAIRLDTLWPFAIRGFLRNPWLGSGYSTLTKYTFDQFTEAESTDNDFLRTLGETGLLGFITFYGTMVLALFVLWRKSHKTHDTLLRLFAVIATAFTVGLMINAVYIDVFVSSKVIQTYWLLIGVMLAYAALCTPVLHVTSSGSQVTTVEKMTTTQLAEVLAARSSAQVMPSLKSKTTPSVKKSTTATRAKKRKKKARA